MIQLRLLRLLSAFALLLSLPSAEASLVSRLGHIYFYDPLTFDSGGLQRATVLSSGVGSAGGSFSAAQDLSFFRDFSIRLGYDYGFKDGETRYQAPSLRLRLPILESARYGHFSSVQVYYARHPSEGIDERALEGKHEIGLAHMMILPIGAIDTSLHSQLGLLLRPSEADLEEPLLSKSAVGFSTRLALLALLYHPPKGNGGMWTVTVSVLEASLKHYGGLKETDGLLQLSAGAPAVHLSPRKATYTVGLSPILLWQYGAGESETGWAAMATFSLSYRRALE